LILSSISCHDDNYPEGCNKRNTVLLPEDAKARFYFKDGTYWVYQDSISKEIDSCWVENSNSEIYHPYNYKTCHEDIYFDVYSSFNEKSRVKFETVPEPERIYIPKDSIPVSDIPNDLDSNSEDWEFDFQNASIP